MDPKTKPETIIYPLICDVCGKRTGQLEIPKPQDPVIITNASLGIDSIHCDDHKPTS